MTLRVPDFTGEPREFNLAWLLTKGTHTARCALWTHPIGAELRIDVDGEWLRSEANRDILALIDRTIELKTQFEEKGWTP